MKVFFTLDTLANAGTEKSTLDMLTHFSKETDATVVYFYPGDDLKADYEKAGIRLKYAGLSGKRSLWAGTRYLIKLIKAEKPDLIVSSIMRANFITRFAGKITGTPVIGTFVNDSYGDLRIEEMKKKGQYKKFRFFWLLDRYTAGIPKYWISNALSIAKSNAQALKLQDKNIKVIYRGRDTGLFTPWSQPAASGKFRFVFIGRLLQRKGLAELMDAIADVKQQYPDIQLDIYGEGVFRKSVEKKIAELQLHDTVIMHGKVLNGWKKLYQADCFLFPSWYEGFSGALVEAMVAGIPIIASDIPMNMEAVDEQTALIFPVKQTDRLAAAMKQMIENYPQMKTMGERARQSAIGRFDIKQVSKTYEQFLHSVVNKQVNAGELVGA